MPYIFAYVRRYIVYIVIWIDSDVGIRNLTSLLNVLHLSVTTN
jgi:hypothetical protein